MGERLGFGCRDPTIVDDLYKSQIQKVVSAVFFFFFLKRWYGRWIRIQEKIVFIESQIEKVVEGLKEGLSRKPTEGKSPSSFHVGCKPVTAKGLCTRSRRKDQLNFRNIYRCGEFILSFFGRAYFFLENENLHENH